MAGASPILTIPVDDAAFKRFLDTFKKYQATLKEQPEMWKSMSAGVDGVAVAAAIMTEEVIRQTEETKKLTTEEEKREKLAQDAARRRKKDEDEQDRRDKKAHDARKRQIDQVREYGRTVSNTVSGFGKWASGGSVMGAASGIAEGAAGLGALGVAGAAVGGLFAALAAGVGASYLANSSLANSYKSAKGFGTSQGKLQGYQNQLQYDFDVDSAFGKMAAMQNDPTALSTFGMMGINPKGKDTADLVKESALAARRMWLADNKNVALAQAQGLTNIYSIPELNTLSANTPAELSAKFAKGDDFAKKYGFTDDQGKKAESLVVAMGNLTDKIKNGLIAELIKLDPILARITNEFSAIADFFAMFDIKKAAASPAANTAEGILEGFALGGPAGAIVGGYTGGLSGWIKKNTPPKGSGSSVSPGGFNLFSALTGGLSGQSNAGNGSLADVNNNPGNIRGRDGGFRKFATPEAGWAAMRRQLLIDYDRYGQHSIRSIINDPGHGWSNEWAKGNTHDSTANYISSVARQLGVGADDELNLHDTKMLQRLAQAMNHVERGTGSGSRKAKAPRSQVHVKVSNQTGSSVATTVHSAAG